MRTLVLVLLVTTSLGGCVGDFVDQFTRPSLSVSRTDLSDTNQMGYVTVTSFSVAVLNEGGGFVEITANSKDGRSIFSSGQASTDQHVSLDLLDGIWTVSYTIDGHDWETFKDVKVDVTPPSLEGVRSFGNAQGGSYTIGANAVIGDDETVSVYGPQGKLLSNSLPFTIGGLSSGIHVFLVEVTDPAGNIASLNIQVAAGDAKLLPEGEHTFGVVARYTNQARIWDLQNMKAYLSPAAARAEVGNQWVGADASKSTDIGIDPNDPQVQAAVADVVTDGMTSMEVAFALYKWMFDNLEYTEERLSEDDLLEPGETIDNGGGVCRDLAGLYVSLLRAAGVPARLVSGYLAGTVNGFHAWVEVYVGNAAGNPGPWMPVDVSPIDGLWEGGPGGIPYGVQIAMQSFGVQLPEYLGLRAIPDEFETDGWSTALGSSYSTFGGAPETSFEKKLTDIGEPQTGLLCFDPDTLQRRLMMHEDSSQCSGMYIIGRDQSNPTFRDKDPFVVGTQRIIDYGVLVKSADSGTKITIDLSYVFPSDIKPDIVEFTPYSNIPSGWSFSQEEPDPATGKIIGRISR